MNHSGIYDSEPGFPPKWPSRGWAISSPYTTSKRNQNVLLFEAIHRLPTSLVVASTACIAIMEVTGWLSSGSMTENLRFVVWVGTAMSLVLSVLAES